MSYQYYSDQVQPQLPGGNPPQYGQAWPSQYEQYETSSYPGELPPQPPGGSPPQYGEAWPSPYGDWPSAPLAAPVPYPPSFAPPYTYPQQAQRPNTLPAYLTGLLFVGCSLLSFVLAMVSWDGNGSPYALAAVVGVVFSGKVTGNVDFGISATMTVACSTLTFAAIQLARLAFARWVLAGIGGLVAAYYAIAVVYLVAHNAMSLIGLPMLALLLWAAATGMALAPFTAKAMRGHQLGPGYRA